MEGGSNHPPLISVQEYFAKSDSGYSKAEVESVWHSFQATASQGTWFMGKRPVGDWCSAMASRLAERKISQTAKATGSVRNSADERIPGAPPPCSVPDPATIWANLRAPASPQPPTA